MFLFASFHWGEEVSSYIWLGERIFLKKANVFYVSNEMGILNIFFVKSITYREEVYKTHEYSPKNNIEMNPHAEPIFQVKQ